jgi:hypothetical protein
MTNGHHHIRMTNGRHHPSTRTCEQGQRREDEEANPMKKNAYWAIGKFFIFILVLFFLLTIFSIYYNSHHPAPPS